jgi:hypothetical protein
MVFLETIQSQNRIRFLILDFRFHAFHLLGWHSNFASSNNKRMTTRWAYAWSMTSRSTPTSGGEHPAGNTRDGNAILTTDSIGILSRCKFNYFRIQTRVALVRNGLIRRYTGAMIYCSVITHKCIQLQSGESGSFPSSIGVMNIYMAKKDQQYYLSCHTKK